MTASSLWPEPRPWGPDLTLAGLRLRLEHGGTDPRPRPEGLAALGRALSALGVAHPAEAAEADLAVFAPETAGGTGILPAPEANRIAAYRDALHAADEAVEAREAALAALNAHDGARPPASADILARMDAIAMLDTAGEDRRAEFAALRDAYDAALGAEAERAEGLPATEERAALLLAVSEAARDAEDALAALDAARAATLGRHDVPPEVLMELHRLLGAGRRAEALSAGPSD